MTRIQNRCEYKDCKSKAVCITKKRISGYLFTTNTCDKHAEMIYYIDFEAPLTAPINTNTVTIDGRIIGGFE